MNRLASGLRVKKRFTLVCVALICVMLTDGYGGGHSRCRGLYGIARICNANGAAPSRAQKYGDLFESTYNAEAKAHGWPHRIVLITCKADGEAIFDCNLKLRFTTTGQIQCGAIAFDTGFDVWVNHQVPCAKLFPRTAA